ncbi:hypothetical protein [Streptomyces atratus]|uniref:hypothetical protein n=1 Tax=Streptomyces atratus TaxID=1893 RepID=UPI00379A02C4
MRRATSTLLGLLLTLLSLGAATTQAHAAPPGYLTLEATYTTVANGWDRVDRYLDTTSGFHSEQYPQDGRGDQDGQRRTFFGGVKQPYSGRFLLYSAPGWNSGSHQTPVLLVHGANDNADRAWPTPAKPVATAAERPPAPAPDSCSTSPPAATASSPSTSPISRATT